MSTQEWKIQAAADACTSCKRAFRDGEPFTSRLTFEDEGIYRRNDFCDDCRDGPGQDEAMSLWRTVFRVPPPPPPEPMQRETAESLLRRFMRKEGAEIHRDAVFVLAVMLERRRILVERDVTLQPDGVRIRVYEHRGTGETFLIADPQLRLDALEQVQEQVIALLGPAAHPETEKKDSTAASR